MKQNFLSDAELLQKTKLAAVDEKSATLVLLKYLVQVDERRAFATLACSSLFEYVMKVLGYSEMQASERVNSARLLRAVPELQAKIENGDISMSTASQVQRFLRQEKKVGNEIPKTETLKIIERCSGQSKREVEKALFALSTEKNKIPDEKIKSIDEHLTELRFVISEMTLQKLTDAKNLIGNESLSEIFDQALNALLIQTQKKMGRASESKLNNPSKCEKSTKSSNFSQSTGDDFSFFKKEGPASRSRFISIHTKRTISARSGNQCEWIDPKTKERCSSRYRLQMDHYPLPFAKGGSNDASNLRHACFQHNQKAAMF